MKTLGVYLTFPGNCEEALTFYKQALKGEILFMQRFKDAPMDSPDAYKERIMHATFKAEGLEFMASDGMPGFEGGKNNQISLSINLTDVKEQDEIFTKLSAGGNVTMPLQDTFWNARFGMLTDKYGIQWMLNVEKK